MASINLGHAGDLRVRIRVRGKEGALLLTPGHIAEELVAAGMIRVAGQHDSVRSEHIPD